VAQALDTEEKLPAVENHGFTIVDFHPERLTLQFFRWSPEMKEQALDTLEPFQRVDLHPRG
jgi:hypothetical protein